MHRYRSQFPLGLMCRVLGVARSSYYAWRRREPSARARENTVLVTRMQALYQASDATYGSPRMLRALQAEGYRCGRHRVARLMRAQGLFAVSRRRWRMTTRRHPRAEPAPNRLARDFRVTGPNQVWAADITYVEKVGPISRPTFTLLRVLCALCVEAVKAGGYSGVLSRRPQRTADRNGSGFQLCGS